MATIIAALMSVRLPVLIDPLQYAHKGLHVEGSVCVSDLERMKERLANQEGELYAALDFDIVDGQAQVTGQIKGHIFLVCQRCMEAMRFEVDTEVKLGLVRSEQEIDSLRDGFEPLMVQPDPVKLQEIIEDEVMLLLPMIPFHENDACQQIGIDEEIELTEPEREINPFAVLEALKKH